MDFTRDGLKLWFGNSDTPAPAGEVSPDQPVEMLVGMLPVHPLNQIDVLYRVNEGVQQIVRGSILRDVPSTTGQFCRVRFPRIAPGSRVQYAPVLRNGGKRLDTSALGKFPGSFSIAPSIAPSKSAAERVPGDQSPVDISIGRFPFKIERTFWIDCQLRLELIGETAQGIRYNFFVVDGTVEGRIQGKILGEGGDWLRVLPNGIALPDIKVTFQLDDGALILMEASGALHLGSNGYADALKGRFIPQAYLETTPRFFTSHPKYQWVTQNTCFGVGLVDMQKFIVHNDIYTVVRPEVRCFEG